MVELAEAATAWLNDEHDDATTADIANAGESMRRAAALHAAWLAMAGDGQASERDLLDVVDLVVSRGEAIEDAAESVARGDYLKAPRDDGGRIDLAALRRSERLAEEAAQKAGIFSVVDAIDILERHLRCYARYLKARPPGKYTFDWFALAVDNTRSTLTGAVAWLALAGEGGTRPVMARDLGDVMEIHAARRGSISGIAADVLAGEYRDHPRDAEDELMFDGRSRSRGRRVERWLAEMRFWEGSRKPRPGLH